ncbi:MAG TPA: efflux RND transporter periplasmic adaptor subunit [Vicinamibacteria bacterium]|nr:efflux RND transporter periplasmic adaptor subunit [Vicinamibacteria bacterium]
MRRRLVVVAGAVLGGAVLLVSIRGRSEPPAFETALVDKGDVVEVVGATGVLEAVTTVQVGSQVSGTVAWLGADFNARVRKGQVVARLEPSLFQARVAQARSNLVAARAQVERNAAATADARQKYERALALAAQSLLPESDLESAKAAYDSAVAQQKASEAAVSQAEAALNQAEVDLGHSVIVAPIDGVVLARNVDVGQTVAASLQAPTLFVIANDLKRMRVNVAIDEADIGRVEPGQAASFRVDAWPDEVFEGVIEQVRLQPIVNQNVVTYNTIVAVSNDASKLMPGMTATVSVETRRRDGVLRVPAAAARFRPEAREPGARNAGPAEAGRRGRERPLYVPGPGGRPEPREAKLGLSDGRYVEVIEGLREGEAVITGQRGAPAAGGAAARPSPGATNNPFSPRREQRTR